MGLNKLEAIRSLKEQREELLELNNDLLFGVYTIKEKTDKGFNLELTEDLLTCYANQLNNLKGLEVNSELIIADLGELRKGKLKILSGNNGNRYNDEGNFKTKLENGHSMWIYRNLVLLSNGVIELIESENNNGKINTHIISTLRDGGAADELQRTTTAGRNTSNNLNEDLEREHIEESPFIGLDSEGNFALATIDNSEKSISILRKSITFFIENKYLKQGDKNYDFVKNNFEKNFGGIKYDNLGKILNEIIDNNRVFTYSTENINNFKGINDDYKKIFLDGISGEYFTYFDEKNNTIEYRLLRKITGFNNGFRPLTKRPSRLYLESENQFPKRARIKNAIKGYVPTVKYFCKKVEELI